MYEKINYKLVGLFVLLFSAAAVYFAFWLSKSGVNKKNYNFYIVYFTESVDGLNKDSAVKLNGVNIGRVEKISVDIKDIKRVRADIAILKNIKITDSMYATLQSQGLTGLRYINILTAGNEGKIIKPNTENSIIKTKISLLSSLSQTAPKTLDKLLEFSQKLDILLSKKNVENFSKILENGAKVTKKAADLEDKLSVILGKGNQINSLLDSFKDLNSTIYEYKILAKNSNLTVKIINKKLPALINNINRAAISIKKVSSVVNKTIKRGDYNLKRILSPALSDLKELSVKYEELGDELKALAQNPGGRLLNGKMPPKGPGE